MIRGATFRQGLALWRVARDEFELYREAAFAAAQDETGGALLNARGRAAHIDPWSLFIGPWARARAYASRELLDWWDLHPGRRSSSSRPHGRPGWRTLMDAREREIAGLLGIVASPELRPEDKLAAVASAVIARAIELDLTHTSTTLTLGIAQVELIAREFHANGVADAVFGGV